MSPIKNVSLAYSCAEKLSGNLFCHKCSHHVIDFRNKTCGDLNEQINKSTKPVCGVFKKSQLSEQFMKYAAATFIATSTAIAAAGQEIKADSLLQSCDPVEQELETEILVGIIIQTQAEPIGGYAKFFNAIKRNIKYPDDLRENGKSFVEFTVDRNGKMKDVRLIKGFNKLADMEAVRILSTLDFPFSPARQRGEVIESRLAIPITFVPNTEEKKLHF